MQCSRHRNCWVNLGNLIDAYRGSADCSFESGNQAFQIKIGGKDKRRGLYAVGPTFMGKDKNFHVAFERGEAKVRQES